MKGNKKFFQDIWFIIVSSMGGFILSLTGLSIGWMIGTLIMAAFLSFRPTVSLKLPYNRKGIPRYWLYAGQCILGIELGQKINVSVIYIFKENWMVIIVMLLLSVIFSLLSGFVLWKFSQTDMLTSFFGTAPGGLSAIPGIAEEVGANTVVVSIIQTMRVFLVVLTVPIIVSSLSANIVDPTVPYNYSTSRGIPEFEIGHLFGTTILVLVACGGYYVGKHLKFPAPWLVGGMLSVSVIQVLSSSYVGHNMIAWWPHTVIILSQILMASSIGSRFHKNMFIGLKKTLLVALLSTLGLIVAMFVCAFFVSKVTGITFVTAALAFAPGGIAEMATTAVVLHADSTLVVVVQVLRVIMVCIILPPFFKLLNQRRLRKDVRSHVSA
ncbi:MAG TPA: AbrB family transcriptional regulator [Bacillus sp. (in: firmicutes)]|nr:AbrB family transcriptional regulator [Bacillus sp. (in: firmicutes)]